MPPPRVWLYQPYPGHDARWDSSRRDRLTAARAVVSRVDTVGSRYSVDVLYARSDWMLRSLGIARLRADTASESLQLSDLQDDHSDGNWCRASGPQGR